MLVGTVDNYYLSQPPPPNPAPALPITWTIGSGTLPPGIAFHNDTCDSCDTTFTGTPTQAGTWPLTLRATDANGSTPVSIAITISTHPTNSPYSTTTELDTLRRYTFQANLSPSSGSNTLTRTDTQTGDAIDVLSVAHAPSGCVTAGTYVRFEAASADGNYVGIMCSPFFDVDDDPYTHLYLLDISSQSTVQVDVPNGDAPSPEQYTLDALNDSHDDEYLDDASWTTFAANGISNDGNEVLFISGGEMTADSVDEHQTVQHLYVRDMATGISTLIAAPEEDGEFAAFRQAALSADSGYIDDVMTSCSDPDGNFCGGVTTEVHRSPLAPEDTSAPCNPVCAGGDYDDWLGNPFGSISTSGDGLTIMYPETINTSTTQTPATGIWNAATGAVVTLPETVSGILAGDGTTIFYTTAVTRDTCELVTRSLSVTGQLGPEIVIGDPPQGLPRTGCSSPIATNSAGDELVFGSSSTNLVPGTAFTSDEDEYAYYRGAV
jgi:hypothetical protein